MKGLAKEKAGEVTKRSRPSERKKLGIPKKR